MDGEHNTEMRERGKEEEIILLEKKNEELV
jgi:hypothetical protein